MNECKIVSRTSLPKQDPEAYTVVPGTLHPLRLPTLGQYQPLRAHRAAVPSRLSYQDCPRPNVK